MRSEEEFNIGQDGIDTQYERDYINYRPAITYAPGKDASGFPTDTAGQDTSLVDNLDGIGESSAIEVWGEVVGVIQKLDQLEQTLSLKLKDISVPVPAMKQSHIEEAARALGYSGVTERIPFDVYKKTFEQPNLPGAVAIQEVYEDYMADVDGILNGELYADVAEMQQDWNEMLDFVKRGLMAQLVPMDKVPREVSTTDVNLKLIAEAEKAMNDEVAALAKLQAVNRNIYMELSSLEYGSDRYFQAVKEYDESKRNLLYAEKKLFTKEEVVDLISRKASDTTGTLAFIEQSIDFDPFSEGRYEMMYALSRQYSGKESAQDGLRKLQAVLKLSVDGKKIHTDTNKTTLRGIAGQPTKTQANRTLINGIHLRNEVFRDVFDMVHNLDGVPANENFEIMINHITDGAAQVDEFYQMQASDFYKTHVMDDTLRRDKLRSLIDKDTARSSYQLIGSMVGYLKDTKHSWPTEEKLSEWLNGFMEHSKLS